jgi:hypothetical protein
MTALGDSKPSDQIIMSNAGLVSKKIRQHQSHVRLSKAERT